MAAPHGSTASSALNPASGVFTKPAGALVGDLAMFSLYCRAGLYEIAAIAGVTTIQNANYGTNGRVWMGYRYIQAGDTTWNFTRTTGSSNADVLWGIDAFPVADVNGTGVPFDAAQVTLGTAVSPDPPSVTPGVSGAIIFIVSGKRAISAGAGTPPTNYTTGWALESTVAWAGTAYRYAVPASPQDPAPWTLGGDSGDYLSISSSLKPATGGVAGVATPGPKAMTLTVAQGWTLVLSEVMQPSPVTIPLAFPIGATVAMPGTLTISPDPLVLAFEQRDPYVTHAAQPEVYAPGSLFSSRMYQAGSSLWTGIARALPIWNVAQAGNSYADDGTVTAYSAPTTTGDDDSGLPEVWYALLNGGADVFNLGTFDPGTSGTILLRIKPLTILDDAVLWGFSDGFEGRIDSLGVMFNDAFLPGSTEPSIDTLVVNEWQSVIFSWGGGENRVYLDTAEILSQTATTDPGSGTLMIGTRTGGDGTVHANVSAIYVWDRELTNAERALISNDPWIMFRNEVGRVAPLPVALPLLTNTVALSATRIVLPTAVTLPMVVPIPASVQSDTNLSPLPFDLPLLVPAVEVLAGVPSELTPDPFDLPLLIPDAGVIASLSDFLPNPVMIPLVIPASTTVFQSGPTVLRRPPSSSGEPLVPVGVATHHTPED